jgi:hypothetical protein
MRKQKEKKMRRKSMTLFGLFVLVVLGFSIKASSNSSSSPLPVTPRDEATVSFDFDGLMGICFGNQERVSAGLLNVPHHTPEIKITRIDAGKRSTMAVLRGEQLRGTFYVDVEGRTKSAVSRYYGESIDDPNDFRWNIDLEGDLYQKKLHIMEEKLFGKIHFGGGLFFASNLTDHSVRFFAADNSGKALPFNRRIAAPSAKINLAIGDTLLIRGVKNSIRLVAEPGVRYEVSVTNLPPSDMANMEHWIYYYDLLGEQVTPYMPVIAQKTAFGPKPLLCMPVVFSLSQLD